MVPTRRSSGRGRRWRTRRRRRPPNRRNSLPAPAWSGAPREVAGRIERGELRYLDRYVAQRAVLSLRQDDGRVGVPGHDEDVGGTGQRIGFGGSDTGLGGEGPDEAGLLHAGGVAGDAEGRAGGGGGGGIGLQLALPVRQVPVHIGVELGDCGAGDLQEGLRPLYRVGGGDEALTVIGVPRSNPRNF